MSLQLKENMDSMFEKLENFFKTKTVVGEPIQVGETTIIPFIDITFGLGIGGGSGKDEKGNDGDGGGAGTGAKISATAILVIRGDQVELLPIKKAGGLEKLIDMVPEIMEKVNDHKSGE
ncbi:spore germination protein GerW family protein [Desulfitobacterium sp. THU1]|uniref:GerW family sporulation protein n=1 Tax=Desulfitobacterium sp. THU1 TaxID=3138072 RepID=UPI00311E9E88